MESTQSQQQQDSELSIQDKLLQSFLENKSETLRQFYTQKSNKEYIETVLSHGFLNQLNNYLKENPESSIEEIKEKILEYSLPYKNSTKELNEIIEILYSIYLKEAVTGPSVYTLYVAETKAPLIKGGPLPDTLLDPLSNKNQSLQDKLLQHFEKDSEQIYLKSQFLVLFYAIEVLLLEQEQKQQQSQQQEQKEKNDDDLDFLLWQARFSYLYDQQLTSSVAHLKDNSITFFEQYIQYFETQYNNQQTEEATTTTSTIYTKQNYVRLLIEQSHIYLNFYKYKECKQCIKKAMNLLNLNLKLTGRLGRRTKYQEFDIAQLVLDVENREVQVIVPQKQEDKSESATTAAKKKSAYGDVMQSVEDMGIQEDGDGEEEKKEQNVKLEEDTILYETPKITDPLGELAKRQLTVEDQLVIQSYVNYVSKTHAKDETRMELLRPYINTCLDISNNWLVYSNSLLQRSRNEIERSKTTERALLQIQTLIDQYRDKEPVLGVRLQYYFATCYPLFWQLQRELAKAYMKIGVYVSAYELLREVELYEDCILSMFMGGRPTLAEELANERLQKAAFAQPGILCLLGDIKKDVSYYQKAWEVSGHKHARAMRSIARIHYFQGDYQKSADCYEKALAISKLYPDAWFTLGCAYMRLEDFKQSIYAYGVSISIDDQNAEAWCNISTCQMRLERYKEAVMCLEQALKHNRKSWKIWENYIILSIETLMFFKAVSAARELLRMDMTDRLNVNLMLKICDVFLKNYVARPVKQEEFDVGKRQLYSFFDEYTSKVAKDWQVWRLIGRIKGILKESHDVVKECKLKEIRALMTINWEHEIEQCEKMERSIDELMKMQFNGPISDDEKLFAKNTITSIEQCLQRKTTVVID